MTCPDRAGAESVARWCAGVAEALAGAAARAGGLADQIARDWLDDHGREWAERTALLHRELGRDALAAAELASALAYRADGDDSTPPAAALRAAAVRSRGVRLGGTEAHRTGGAPGMTIAQLPDHGAPPG